MKRGDVYFVKLPYTPGMVEQSGDRPCVILQNDTGNAYSCSVIVAPITSSVKKKMPTHVYVKTMDGMLVDSVVLLEQIRTIDKKRILNYLCHFSSEVMERIDNALAISIGLEKRADDERGKSALKNDVKIFGNNELGLQIRTILNDDGSISINAEDTAIGFGWKQTQVKGGRQYTSVRWETLNGYCESFGFPNKLGKDDYIPESLFYRLGMKANNTMADKFQNWLAMEVIPSIRKTGGYHFKPMTPEEMMRVQLGMIDKHEERIVRLENTMNIDYEQQRTLEKEVASVVIESLGGKNSNAYREISKKVFSECNRDVKDYFHVNSRNNIPRVRFEDAVSYIQNWVPCVNTRMLIKECNFDTNG